MNYDLNLLPALQVLLQELNVSRAAEKLDVSQPAMSRILTRLREQFDDPLLVRTGNQYQRTVFAERLLQNLNQVMPELAQLSQKQSFDPASVDQTVIISGTDMDIVYLSRGVRRIQKLAPNLELAIRTSHPRVLDDLVEGRIDLALTAFENDRSGLYRKLMSEENFVAIVDNRSPLTSKNLTLKRYLDHRHGKFSFAEPTLGRIDAALEAMGKRRQVTLQLPTFSQIPPFLKESELIFSVPKSFADYLEQHFPVKQLPLPFKVQTICIYLYWHQRQHNNPLHRWVRQQLLAG